MKSQVPNSDDEDLNIAAHLHLGKHMLQKVKSFGDRINAATDERMTFNELAQQSVDIALSLAHIGVKKGDIVAICSSNRMEYIPIAFGTLLAGAVLANINENKEIIKSDTDIEKTIVFDEPVEGAIHFKDFLSQHASVEDFEATPVNGCEDLAIILFTSGTTGMPKGVRHTHYSFLCSVQDPSIRIPSAEVGSRYYGMTEFGCICNAKSSRFGYRQGSVGGVRKMFVVKIVDVETREPLGPHQRGEICCKSPTLLQGYIGGEVDYLDEEGFFKTGDLGYYDEDQYVYVVDRIKDIIKYNCFAVYPFELEAVLLQHPSVHEVGVVGAPHGEAQELPTAFVVLKPGTQVTEQELIDFFNKTVAQNEMQMAGGVRFINELPRGAGLKLDRKKLRSML
ncbi:uncharacterized protein LOC126779774 [Nymphalis io]|uniref:uncharacterized protein LOC126779774 n=1 Tax=Inachis io TaxID=171585 RepID=UPI002167A64D|nr:uncharacterized protein LOC126779774 [Nymphalis io]